MFSLSINTTKNLLAFSAGIDSTALFFILLEKNIPFDIAIVDYNQRKQAKEEVAYAKALAKQYNKICFVKEVTLDSTSNFEKNARNIRYSFFESLIQTHQYQTLLTAHQLNDKLEWFLMQLTKGAGLSELLGLEASVSKKDYTLLRPLLEHTKEELQAYLHKHQHQYFIDQSNTDESYKRNYFRHQFSQKLLAEFSQGVSNSFKYLEKDLNSLNLPTEATVEVQALEVFKNCQDDNKNIKIIDKSLKRRGILLSKGQRDEILRQKEITISKRFCVAVTAQYIWIAPSSQCVMEKTFKEQCRVKKIPKNIRAYLFEEKIDIEKLVF